MTNTIKNQRYDEVCYKTLNSHIIERVTFTDCDFTGCDMRHSSFMGCTFVRCALPSADISRSSFGNTTFTDCDFVATDFIHAKFDACDFYTCNMERVNFTDAMVRHTGFSDCKGDCAIFERASLVSVSFHRCELGDAYFKDSLFNGIITASVMKKAVFHNASIETLDAEYSNFDRATFRRATFGNLRVAECSLQGINTSGAKGFYDPIEWVKQNFEMTAEGVIAYKRFSMYYSVPDEWDIKRGGVITENVDPDPFMDCGCGINIATKEWILKQGSGEGVQDRLIWKVLVRWEWLISAVVPFASDGKWRVGKVELIEPIYVDRSDQNEQS